MFPEPVPYAYDFEIASGFSWEFSAMSPAKIAAQICRNHNPALYDWLLSSPLNPWEFRCEVVFGLHDETIFEVAHVVFSDQADAALFSLFWGHCDASAGSRIPT